MFIYSGDFREMYFKASIDMFSPVLFVSVKICLQKSIVKIHPFIVGIFRKN